jgi:site-specific recombinase XerD
LEGIDIRTAVGKRDYAILLLLITYGLRSSEVAALTLDHFDWERERFVISDRKAGHQTAYPLSSIVGKAIIDYLKNGRPNTKDRHIFCLAKAPRGPLTHKVVSDRVRYYLQKSGVQVHRPGSHTLRYTCVQRLVDAEFSFKVIGDYVGHASPYTTKNYSMIDVERLRKVAIDQEEGGWL